MYDVIVVGARCAGAATAMLLARKGYKVLVVDRAEFPSDIPHGHFIHHGGPQRLRRWGLLDAVLATGCPPARTMTIDLGDVALTSSEIVAEDAPFGIGPRRTALDKVLVDAAIRAGATLREGFSVEDFLSDGDRITGIRGHDRGSSVATERATVTVGADGRNSRLARKVAAQAYEVVPTLTCWYYTYWSGVPDHGLEVRQRGNHVTFAFPTNDGLFTVFVALPAAELPRVRADVEGQFMAVVAEVPELDQRLRNGRREERFYGATDLPNFLRKPFGPGWALVGDAGCHKDPYLALGICDAFRDAELLAEALDEGLSGKRPLDSALADYERLRNEQTLPDFHENIELARLKPPPPEFRQLIAALRLNQEESNRFFLAREGLIPRATFFNRENLRRIAMAAGAPPARAGAR